MLWGMRKQCIPGPLFRGGGGGGESDEARCHLATDCFASLMKVTMSLNTYSIAKCVIQSWMVGCK